MFPMPLIKVTPSANAQLVLRGRFLHNLLKQSFFVFPVPQENSPLMKMIWFARLVLWGSSKTRTDRQLAKTALLGLLPILKAL
jgi:hypothetical protein